MISGLAAVGQVQLGRRHQVGRHMAVAESDVVCEGEPEINVMGLEPVMHILPFEAVGASHEGDFGTKGKMGSSQLEIAEDATHALSLEEVIVILIDSVV